MMAMPLGRMSRFTSRGNALFDFLGAWTPFGVVKGDCKSLTQTLAPGEKKNFTTTISGVPSLAACLPRHLSEQAIHFRLWLFGIFFPLVHQFVCMT